MDYGNQAASQANYISQAASTQIRTPAIDQLNGRLDSVHLALSQALSRVSMIANKMTGAQPPTDKAGAPAAVPSCSMDWLSDIDRRLADLDSAINRLD